MKKNYLKIYFKNMIFNEIFLNLKFFIFFNLNLRKPNFNIEPGHRFYEFDHFLPDLSV